MKINKGQMAMMIAIAVIIIDQVLKIWVKTSFYYGESLYITGWFQLVFIENNGMAFGWSFINKIFLTSFRIVAAIFFVYYLIKMSREKVPTGYIVCCALITAGTIGNAIDCLLYGQIFNNPYPPEIATMFPEGGGYAPLFEGRVVDMLFFPLCQWTWPEWLPVVGGEHFLFFHPVFNVADASLSVGMIILILFYSKWISTPIPGLSRKKESED